jgi:hypothetical protein
MVQNTLISIINFQPQKPNLQKISFWVDVGIFFSRQLETINLSHEYTKPIFGTPIAIQLKNHKTTLFLHMLRCGKGETKISRFV